MLGILSITIKNGRGLITYGGNLPKVYNMRQGLFAIIFISCSVCVFSDLEVYPGISLEDQRTELSNGKFIPLFEERRWHDKESWPRLQQEYFGNGQNQPKFNARIAESFKKIRDMLNKQTKELKEKVHNSMNSFAIPEHESQEFNPVLNDDLDHYKHSNQHVLEDVRPYPQENSDFSFNEDYNNEENDNILNEDVYVEGVRDNNYYIDENGDKDLTRKQIFYDTKLDDDNFAYSPSDPRFYEELTYPENMVQREVFPKDMHAFNGQSQNIAQDGDANRISYTGAYQEIMDDPRERTDTSVEVVAVQPNSSKTDSAGVYIIAVVAGISAAATVGLIAFTIGWYNLQKHVKNASDVEYPAYGITGPNKEMSPSGDRRLAQSAQMYHYQHQKQQIIAMERGADNERRGSVSEADSDEENEEGDYTVYEYAGLAPIGEMEVKNPLFQDEPTPAQSPAVKTNDNIQKK